MDPQNNCVNVINKFGCGNSSAIPKKNTKQSWLKRLKYNARIYQDMLVSFMARGILLRLLLLLPVVNLVASVVVENINKSI